MKHISVNIFKTYRLSIVALLFISFHNLIAIFAMVLQDSFIGGRVNVNQLTPPSSSPDMSFGALDPRVNLHNLARDLKKNTTFYFLSTHTFFSEFPVT